MKRPTRSSGRNVFRAWMRCLKLREKVRHLRSMRGKRHEAGRAHVEREEVTLTTLPHPGHNPGIVGA
eukprot:11460886-Alexandrium_andersonii.AAC.1